MLSDEMSAGKLDVGHSGCRDVLKMAAESLGWEVVLHTGGTLVWQDGESGACERLAKLRSNQWMSWIPGMQYACGKVALAQALEQSAADFWPRSWRIPGVSIESICEEAFENGDSMTLIIKPDQGSQGSGISIVQSREHFLRALRHVPAEGAIVQTYVDRPMLLDRCKWDMRIYVLVVPIPNCSEHAIFLEEEGLVRVCTEEYRPPRADNLQRSMVHLTNYSLNKFSANFVHGGDPNDATSGSKRSLSAVLQLLEEEHGVGFSAQACWQALGNLARHTAEAIVGQLATTSLASPQLHQDKLSRCFHIIGLDVLLDEQGTPWLLEANGRPSLLVDEIHPIAGSYSRAELNQLFAAQKLSDRGGNSSLKWGRPCRCSLSPTLHEHQLCAVDVAAKLPAVQGAMTIVQRAQLGANVTSWSDGTAFRLV